MLRVAFFPRQWGCACSSDQEGLLERRQGVMFTLYFFLFLHQSNYLYIYLLSLSIYIYIHVCMYVYIYVIYRLWPSHSGDGNPPTAAIEKGFLNGLARNFYFYSHYPRRFETSSHYSGWLNPLTLTRKSLTPEPFDDWIPPRDTSPHPDSTGQPPAAHRRRHSRPHHHRHGEHSPTARQPHSNSLCSPPKEGPGPGSALRHVDAGLSTKGAFSNRRWGHPGSSDQEGLLERRIYMIYSYSYIYICVYIYSYTYICSMLASGEPEEPRVNFSSSYILGISTYILYIYAYV